MKKLRQFHIEDRRIFDDETSARDELNKFTSLSYYYVGETANAMAFLLSEKNEREQFLVVYPQLRRIRTTLEDLFLLNDASLGQVIQEEQKIEANDPRLAYLVTRYKADLFRIRKMVESLYV